MSLGKKLGCYCACVYPDSVNYINYIFGSLKSQLSEIEVRFTLNTCTMQQLNNRIMLLTLSVVNNILNKFLRILYLLNCMMGQFSLVHTEYFVIDSFKLRHVTAMSSKIAK